MLQGIRDRRQGVVVRVFIGFIIAVFALFGIDSIVGTLTSETTVVSVNGVEIDEYALDSETQVKTQELFNTLGPDIDPSTFDTTAIRNSALRELIEQELLNQSAGNSGMRISSAFLDRQIARTSDFQVDGVFDDERAQILLQSYGYTPSTYRATLAREGVLNQLLLAYSGSGFATQQEINQLAALTMQKRNFRYLLLGLQGQAGIEVPEEDINTYYQDNQPEFMLEEQVSIEYLEINRDDLLSDIEISEEQLQVQYDLENASYQSQIERRASHILLLATDDESYAIAQEQANDLKARIENGESFAALAVEFSEDTGSAEEGGDIGFTTGTSFDDAFETALQTLELNEVSSPVRTDFGVHLIQLTERSSTDVDSFEQSKERIMRDLQTRQADDLYLAQLEELGNLSFESIDLDDPADIMGLTKQTTSLFGRSGGVGVAAQSGVITAAFGSDVLEDGLNSDLIALSTSRSIVIRSIEHNPPMIKDFNEVKGEIEIMLQIELIQDQVLSIGETIVQNIENDNNIDGLLTAQGLNWNQVNDFERSNTTLNPEFVDKIFSVNKPGSIEDPMIEGFQLSTGEYLIIELQEVVTGSLTDMEAVAQDNLKAYITQQSATDDYSGFLNGMQARADIRQ